MKNRIGCMLLPNVRDEPRPRQARLLRPSIAHSVVSFRFAFNSRRRDGRGRWLWRLVRPFGFNCLQTSEPSRRVEKLPVAADHFFERIRLDAGPYHCAENPFIPAEVRVERLTLEYEFFAAGKFDAGCGKSVDDTQARSRLETARMVRRAFSWRFQFCLTSKMSHDTGRRASCRSRSSNPN